MSLRKKAVIALVCLTLSSVTFASNAWYKGVVTRVALNGSDGSFVVTVDSGELDDCKHKYAYFVGSKLGEGRLKAAYSIALTSLTTNKKMGMVIDKEENGPDGICRATGMTADLRAN